MFSVPMSPACVITGTVWADCWQTRVLGSEEKMKILNSIPAFLCCNEFELVSKKCALLFMATKLANVSSLSCTSTSKLIFVQRFPQKGFTHDAKNFNWALSALRDFLRLLILTKKRTSLSTHCHTCKSWNVYESSFKVSFIFPTQKMSVSTLKVET